MTGFNSKQRMAADKLQEPVAWMYQCTADNSGSVLLPHRTNWAESGTGLWIETPLYIAPPQRPWVGLTQKEVQEIHDTYHKRMGPQEFASMIGAKLKEKNNG
jgi:hypothetical protein